MIIYNILYILYIIYNISFSLECYIYIIYYIIYITRVCEIGIWIRNRTRNRIGIRNRSFIIKIIELKLEIEIVN